MTGPAQRARKLRRHLSGTRDKRYQYRRALGLPSPLTDAAPMQAHLDKLIGWGLSYNSVAQAAGVAATFVRDHHQRRYDTVFSHYAAAILAVNYRPTDRQTMVLAIGARRRVEALAAIGYSLTDQAAHVGMGRATNLRDMVRQTLLSATTHRAITAMFDEWSGTPGPSARSITWAAKAGYLPPLAWEDDAIDDPDAQPAAGRRSPTVGVPAEDIAWLMSPAGGALTAELVAERFGLRLETVHSAVSRHRHRHRQKVTDEQAEEIRRRGAAGESGKALAAAFGISPSHVSVIRSGKRRAPLAPAMPDQAAG